MNDFERKKLQSLGFDKGAIEETAKGQIAANLSQIQKQGYVLLKNILQENQVLQLLGLINQYYLTWPKPKSETIPYLNQGHHVLYNLQNKDLIFIKTCLNHPDVTPILIQLLNDKWYKQIPVDKPNYILRGMLARSGGPAALPLHLDSFVPSCGSYPWSAQVSFILQDQSPDNGCTTVVPGSHLYDTYVDPQKLPEVTPISSEAGDVLIWDSRLWHGTTPNTTGKTRWALISTYTRWWLKQNYDIPGALPQNFYQSLTDEEKTILGFCSKSPRDEFERIDIKGGFDLF